VMAIFDVAFEQAVAKTAGVPSQAGAKPQAARTPLDETFEAVEHFEYDPTRLVIAASVIGEQYRTLKTNLSRLKEMEGVGSFVFTSSMKDEGKSTVVLNTARAFAWDRDVKVAVVDCDFKRPGIGPLCGVEGAAGFEDVMAGSAALAECGVYSKRDNFVVFPIRRTPEETSGMLKSAAVDRVLGQLESSFDVILLDTSPVLSTTEPLVFGARAGGVVLVVRANATQRESVLYAQGQLEQAGCRLLGLVLNARPSYVPRFLWLRKYDYFQDGYTYRSK
jgi:capsular exopolysaccharide synthesis family protein